MNKVITIFVLVALLQGCTQTASNPNNADTTDPLLDLAELLGKQPTYKVTYVVSAANTPPTQYTLYFKNGNGRFDATIAGAPFRSWRIGSTVTTCFALNQTEQCTESPEDANTLPQRSADEWKYEWRGYTVTRLANRTIANEQAQCFSLSIPSEYCVSNEGIILYYKEGRGSATVELTAVAITRTVLDSEMVPPPITTQTNVS